MPKLTLKQFAEKMGLHPSMITRARKKGILDAAIVPIEGKKRVLIDLAKGKKLYNANHDPNFRKREQLKRGQKNNPKGVKAAKKKGEKPKQKTKGKGKEESKTDNTYLSSRATLEKYKAAEKKLAFEIKQGLWIEKKEVQDKLFKISRVCRNTLLNIPARTAALVAAKSKKNRQQCFAIIHKEVKTAIEDYLKEISKI